ncbi:hypothetical protein QJQ45_012194 [Haematococcus lacustris]|nr:hypothetical protein QJQ45_012194 [Haematococcus lacustris]
MDARLSCPAVPAPLNLRLFESVLVDDFWTTAASASHCLHTKTVNKQAKKLWPDRILALAHGAAGINGSGTIGCRGVPVSQMLKEAVKQFRAGRVVLVDEFRTSRVSSADNTPSEALLNMMPESFL